MCEANAYIIRGKDRELVMEAVDTALPEGPDSIRLTSIFGEQKILKAKIHSLSLVDHKIFLKQGED
ncbi:MAG: CooT family nickel-binding protein [Desulfobacterales bacterium]|nr:CooT family nickel-binding protein [Desulfobacterales bacterium]